MNSMHNSFGGGGGGGGYSSPYPGYMPPSALPYYNGYPGELAASQTPSAYYGKSPAAMAGYSTGMAGYSAPNINNSMYYQQYGLGYQYGYGKYGLGAGLTPALGYGSEIGAAGIAPSSLGGLQAPTTDLGLTGSMFSKGSGGSNNKFSLGNSSPHSLAPTHTNSSMSSAIAQTPPSHSPHSLGSSLRGHIATPSPPVDPADCKKDLDKMRRCQLCGQVFRLMSECLAHMKAVHEAPMSMYTAMPHSSHAGQSIVPPHMATHSPGRSSSLSNTPDSPLMALERMGWGKEQNVMPSLHSSSPLSQPYGSSMPAQQSMSSHQLNMIPNSHLPDPRYGDPSQQSAKRLNDFYNSCTNQASSHHEHQPVMESHLHHPSSSSSSSSGGFKSRKSSSYSVSSIIGENSDNRQDRRDMLERGGIGSVDPPQTHSPSLPPSLTPNLPITSTPNLPPNLSPNLPPQIHQSYSSSSHSSQPPQLAPNTPSLSHPANHSGHVHLTPPSLSPSYASQTSAASVQSPNASDSYQSQNITQKLSDPPLTSCSSDARTSDPNSSYNCSVVCSEAQNFKHSSHASSECLSEESHLHEMYNSGESPHNSLIAHSHSFQTQESQIEQNVRQETIVAPLEAEQRTKSPDSLAPSSCKNDVSSYGQCSTSASAAAVSITTTHALQESYKHLNYDEQFPSIEKPVYGGQEELGHDASEAHTNNSEKMKEPPGDVSETSEKNASGSASQIHNEENQNQYEYSVSNMQASEVFDSNPVPEEKPAITNFTDTEDRDSQQDQLAESGAESSATPEEESKLLLNNEYSSSEKIVHEVASEHIAPETEPLALGLNHVAEHPSECESASVVHNETITKDPTEGTESSCNQQPNIDQVKTNSNIYSTNNTPENQTTSDDLPQVSNKEILESEADNSNTAIDESVDEENAHQEGLSGRTHGGPLSEPETNCSTNVLDDLAGQRDSAHEEIGSKAIDCESTADKTITEEPHHPSGAEEDIGDDDEPGDPRHPLRESIASPGRVTQQASSWPSTSASTSSCASPLPQVSKCSQPPHTPPLVPLPTNVSPHSSEQSNQYSQPYFPQQQQQKLHAPPTSEYQEKSSISHPSPSPKPHQPGPYRGAWPPGYPSTGTSNSTSGGHGSYGYHQQQYTPPQNCSGPSMIGPQSGSPSSKVPAGPIYPSHSRYSNQFMPSGFDGRRPMPNTYSSQGHWYPGPGRGDGKSNWPTWGSSQSHGYPQSYYYGNGSSGNPPVVSHQHPPSSVKYPPHQTSPHPPPPSPHPHPPSPHPTPPKSKPAESSPAVVSPPPVMSVLSQEPPKITGNSAKKKETLKQETSSEVRKTPVTNDKPRRKRSRPGPKSRVDHKQSQAPQLPQPNAQPLPDTDNSLLEGSTQQNGSINTINANVLTPPATTSVESSDSSDSDADETPKLAVLKPAKRFKGPDGSFVGPKRIKLAKMVRQRQHTRQKLIEDQIKQSELEEQLTQQWVERASEQEGPLANVLLQSSLLLGDQNVDEQEVMEECIATMTAQLQQAAHSTDYDASHLREKTSNSHGALLALKKPGRKNAGHKVLHNYNSVVVRTAKKEKFVPKLRAKDFKWSHYIKSMRYWCKDCGHGFKNQKESQQHGEEQCKANCLYMLECYVSVTDIVQHKLYGNKVEELLEEYQVDGEHKCGRCGTIVLRKADFLVHLDTHKDFMPWECTICGTRFKIRGSLKEHLRYTHMKGRVPCLKCNKVFPTSTLLRQHVKVHTQHYKYSRTGKHREEDLRMAREAIDDTDDTSIPSDQLSHEANEYRNWCKLMELNAMKNIATSDLIDANKEALVGDAELSGGEETNAPINTTSNGETSASLMS